MREARRQSRGYATSWEWAPNPKLVELGVTKALAEYLASTEDLSWTSLEAISDDPPDALLVSSRGLRVGVEVTEIVDPKFVAWHRHKKKLGLSYPYHWAPWDEDRLRKSVERSILTKDEKLSERHHLFDQTFVALFTAEPAIDLTLARAAIQNLMIDVNYIDRAYLILSYDPSVDKREFPQGIAALRISLQRD